MYKKTIRLDEETIELIGYLKKMHISWQKLVISDIKTLLKTKATEMQYQSKTNILPF